jgi:hypothetical protein
VRRPNYLIAAGLSLSLVVRRLPKVPIGGSLAIFLAGATLCGLTVATLGFKARNGAYESLLDSTGRAVSDLLSHVFVRQLATKQTMAGFCRG